MMISPVISLLYQIRMKNNSCFIIRYLPGVIFILFLFVEQAAYCQALSTDIAAWEPDIRKFEQLDSAETYSPASILFAGSSSIRLWAGLAEDMAPYEVIQRGYGGAKLDDLLYYSERIIYPHQFRAIVLFIANDIVGSEKDKTTDEVQRLAGEVIKVIRNKYPVVPIFYIATTPTPLRWQVWPLIKEANAKIEQLCRNGENTYFINTDSAFISNGLPVDTLFLGDRLHLNNDGYRVWRDLIKKELDRIPVLLQNSPSTDR